jgi:hypothetical protein
MWTLFKTNKSIEHKYIGAMSMVACREANGHEYQVHSEGFDQDLLIKINKIEPN